VESLERRLASSLEGFLPPFAKLSLELRNLPNSSRPEGLRNVEEFYTECGFLRLAESSQHQLSEKELTGLTNLDQNYPEHRRKNYIIGNNVERKNAEADGWKDVLKSVDWDGTGVLDATAGYVRADKACIWLSMKAKHAAVCFIEGELNGKVIKIVVDSLADENKIRGVETADGIFHPADLVIVAGKVSRPLVKPTYS